MSILSNYEYLSKYEYYDLIMSNSELNEDCE